MSSPTGYLFTNRLFAHQQVICSQTGDAQTLTLEIDLAQILRGGPETWEFRIGIRSRQGTNSTRGTKRDLSFYSYLHRDILLCSPTWLRTCQLTPLTTLLDPSRALSISLSLSLSLSLLKRLILIYIYIYIFIYTFIDMKTERLGSCGDPPWVSVRIGFGGHVPKWFWKSRP